MPERDTGVICSFVEGWEVKPRLWRLPPVSVPPLFCSIIEAERSAIRISGLRYENVQSLFKNGELDRGLRLQLAIQVDGTGLVRRYRQSLGGKRQPSCLC